MPAHYSPEGAGRGRGGLAAAADFEVVGLPPLRAPLREVETGFTVRSDLIFSWSRSSARLRALCISFARIRTIAPLGS